MRTRWLLALVQSSASFPESGQVKVVSDLCEIEEDEVHVLSGVAPVHIAGLLAQQRVFQSVTIPLFSVAPAPMPPATQVEV